MAVGVMAGVEGRGWTVGSSSGAPGAAEADFGVAGVEAEGVAVPEVDGGVGDRGAGADVEDGDAELEGKAGLVLGDVGAEELVGDVEGADLLLGDEGAGGGVVQGEGGVGAVEGSGGGEGVGEESAAGEGRVLDGVGLVLSEVLCGIGIDAGFGVGDYMEGTAAAGFCGEGVDGAPRALMAVIEGGIRRVGHPARKPTHAVSLDSETA